MHTVTLDNSVCISVGILKTFSFAGTGYFTLQINCDYSYYYYYHHHHHNGMNQDLRIKVTLWRFRVTSVAADKK
jgi:hypothetical protein